MYSPANARSMSPNSKFQMKESTRSCNSTDSMRESSAVTTFCSAARCQISVENWPMMSRLRDWRGKVYRVFKKSVSKRLVISEDREVTRFKHVFRILDSVVDSEKFSVIRAIFPLRIAQLFFEKKVPPRAIKFLLKRSAHRKIRSIADMQDELLDANVQLGLHG